MSVLISVNLNQSVYLSAHHYILCFDFTFIDYSSMYIKLCDSKVLYESLGFCSVTSRTPAPTVTSVFCQICCHINTSSCVSILDTWKCEFCNYISCYTGLGAGNKKPCFKVGTLQRLSKMCSTNSPCLTLKTKSSCLLVFSLLKYFTCNKKNITCLRTQ
jgi:hypothetical protein